MSELDHVNARRGCISARSSYDAKKQTKIPSFNYSKVTRSRIHQGQGYNKTNRKMRSYSQFNRTDYFSSGLSGNDVGF